MDRLQEAAAMLRAAQRVAASTGAGISAESGLATFRGPDGLWEGHRVEQVATPSAFEADPVLVWRFYNMRREHLAKARPNPGHQALADLESRLGRGRFTLITQNVDGLHQEAGSSQVLEIHGSIRRVRCTGCGQTTDRGVETLGELPRCVECDALLRPAVVWFHEALPQDVWLAADEAVRGCQCLLVIGTSAQVYPAAGLIALAKQNGARIIEVNTQPTPATDMVDVTLLGPSGEVLPKLVEQAFGSRDG